MTEENFQENEAVLFRNVDADVDKFQIELEKQIEKLPETLRFIKEYIYFEFLPSLENTLDELEKIKKTPNYDEKTPLVRPMSIRKISNEILTCIDLLNNNNIKDTKISKMIYGTLKGNIGIYDIDNDKIVNTLNISKNHRVENLSTSTTKFYDTYHTRIAANCRSEIYIYIFAYNHSFSGFHTECIINTISPEIQTPVIPEKLQLTQVISQIKLSKDGFFLSVNDYAGGVRIFNFTNVVQGTANIVENKEEEEKKGDTSQSGVDNQQSQQSLNKTSKKDKSTIDKEKLEKTNSGLNMNNLNNLQADNNNPDGTPKFKFVGRFITTKKENFTIIPKEAQNLDDKKTANKNPAKTDNKKKDAKDPKEKKEEIVENKNEYNIVEEFDEEKGDISFYQILHENNPIVHFVQKKFITEDNSNSEYSSSTVTIGCYIAFSNTTNFKFVSLYEYLTDKMKAVFKIKKVRNNVSLSVEDSMNLNSQMHKKEKEFLEFVRKKLESKTGKNLSEISDVNESKDNTKQNIKEDPKNKDKKQNKNDEKIEKKPEKITQNSYTQTELISKTTRKEMNFTTCFNICIMSGQKNLNKVNNLMGIGMIDGSILIWDCELHTDKFLLQKNSRFEITAISIDENFLICGTIKGQVYVYELLKGNEIFTCFHNPYNASSLENFIPFYSFLNVGFDSTEKVCIYNMKEMEKCGKISMNSDILTTVPDLKISFCNRFLTDYNDKFYVFVVEKIDKDKSNDKTTSNSFGMTSNILINNNNNNLNQSNNNALPNTNNNININNNNNNNLNQSNNNINNILPNVSNSNMNLANTTNTPINENLIKTHTSGMSDTQFPLKKNDKKSLVDLIHFSHERIDILRNKPNNSYTDFYNINILKSNENILKIEKKPIEENVSVENTKKEDDKKKKDTKKDNKKTKEQSKIIKNEENEEEKEPEIPTKLDIKPTFLMIFKLTDLIFKCYPDLVYGYKKGISIRKIMKNNNKNNYSKNTGSIDVNDSFNKKDRRKSVSNSKRRLSEKGINVRNNLLAGLQKNPDKDSKNSNKEDKENEYYKNEMRKNEEEKSTQQKDIFYNSFNNIKKRFQYREERANNLLKQKKNILHELKKDQKKNGKKK